MTFRHAAAAAVPETSALNSHMRRLTSLQYPRDELLTVTWRGVVHGAIDALARVIPPSFRPSTLDSLPMW